MKCPKCGHEWKNSLAQDIAQQANGDPNFSAKRVLAAMPVYTHALPRRSWIKTFLGNLTDPKDPRFIDLK